MTERPLILQAGARIQWIPPHVTPLHVQIALHYHCRLDQYEMVTSNSTRREYAEHLVEAGLLERITEAGNDAVVGYAKTGGLAVWGAAICATPFPVQQWVIPDQSS